MLNVLWFACLYRCICAIASTLCTAWLLKTKMLFMQHQYWINEKSQQQLHIRTTTNTLTNNNAQYATTAKHSTEMENVINNMIEWYKNSNFGSTFSMVYLNANSARPIRVYQLFPSTRLCWYSVFLYVSFHSFHFLLSYFETLKTLTNRECGDAECRLSLILSL